MGSYWAYYELGWGGFWFWDPVENASFMPWLAGTALLHSAIVMEKRSALKIWTILLAILTFSFSLLGTFLVRSGVLTSVHAFATDPTRGVFILAILTIFIGGSLALFALRANALTAGGLFHPISREGALVLNNLFLTTAAATVFIGTLYPLFIEAITGDKISVGAPFFDMTFGPLMLPLLVVVPFGPLLAWKRGDVLGVAQRLYAAFGGALLAVLVVLLFVDGASVFAALGVGLAAWLVLGALTDLATKSGIGSVAPGVALRRLRRPAALGVRHVARPYGAGADGARHRQHADAAGRKHHLDQARRGDRDRRLHAALRRHHQGRGPELQRRAGALRAVRRGAPAGRRDHVGQALLPGPADADHRSRHQDAVASASSIFRSATTARTARWWSASGGSRWSR